MPLLTPEQAQQLQQIQQPQQTQAPDPLAAQADALSKQIATLLTIQQQKPTFKSMLPQMVQGAAIGAQGGNIAQNIQGAQEQRRLTSQGQIQDRINLLNQIRQQQTVNRQASTDEQRLAIQKAEEARAADLAPLQKQNVQSEIDQRNAAANAPVTMDLSEGQIGLVIDRKTGKVIQTIEGKPKPGPTPTFNEQAYQDWLKDPKNAGKGRDEFQKAQKSTPADQSTVILGDDPQHPGQQIPIVVDKKTAQGRTVALNGETVTRTPTAQLTASAQEQKDYEVGVRDLQAIKELAAQKTYAADQAIADRYFNIIKPGSGARMTNDNINRLVSPGPLKDKLIVWSQKLDQGQPLDDAARQDLIKAATTVVNSKNPKKEGAAAPATGGWSVKVKPK